MLLLVWLFLFGGVWSGSAAIDISDDIDGKIRSGFYFPGIVKHLSNGAEERWLKQYFGRNSKITWFEENNEAFRVYKDLMDFDLTPKGLTFNIYDDFMRSEAIALFRLLQSTDRELFHMTVAWASLNVNDGILEYALRLAIIHTPHLNDLHMPPPFTTKPNYFFNSETLRKANTLKLKNGLFAAREAKVNQYYRTNDIISINTNYSGWNLLGNGCLEKLAYFREDIGLNSFYYGVHLTYPFWMSTEEPEMLDPKHIQQYYFIHQQMLARYFLEAEANGLSEDEAKSLSATCEFPTYNPYLEYRNGLSFPVRYPFDETREIDTAAYLLSVDTNIKELAGRGLSLVKIYGYTLNMTAENYFEKVSKIIRANIDGVKSAKAVRSLYGAQGYPVDKYNPAPSVLHHPETSLRDPVYWGLINYAMSYFEMFKATSPVHNLTEYETGSLEISVKNISKLVTYFEYFQTDLSNALAHRIDYMNQRNLMFTARQKRLSHSPLNIEMIVNSNEEDDATVRLFLGPKCAGEGCFEIYNRWYQLDTFHVHLKQGINNVSWNSAKSIKYSTDKSSNIDLQLEGKIIIGNEKERKTDYNMFKFPERLVLPKGTVEGYNVTLFLMITKDNEIISFDQKPLSLGFPFDKLAAEYNPKASNYKFIDTTIYHNIDDTKKSSGYFSPNLD